MVKGSEVLQCSYCLSNKVSNILEDIQTIGSCCLYVFDYSVTISLRYISYSVSFELYCTVGVLNCFVTCGCVYVWVL